MRNMLGQDRHILATKLRYASSLCENILSEFGVLTLFRQRARQLGHDSGFRRGDNPRERGLDLALR